MNRLTLTLGLAAMDLAWVYPWSVLLGMWTNLARPTPLLSPLSVFGLALLGALSTQSLGRPAARNRRWRFALVSLGVLAVLLAVRLDQDPDAAGVEWVGRMVRSLAVLLGEASGPAFAFALGLFVWWRGVRLGSQTATYVEVESAFRWGIGLLVTFVLVMVMTTRPSLRPTIEGQTTGYVVGFFFVSLLTLALGRLESLRTRTRTLGVNGQWLAVLIVLAGLIVLLALLLGQLVSFDLLLVVTRPLFDVLGGLLLILAYIVIIPLAYVVEWLVYLVLMLVHFDADRPPPQLLQSGAVDNLLQRLFAQGIAADVLAALKALGAALLLIVALAIVARAIARWRPASADAEAADEERDSLWVPGRVRQALLAWLRRLWQRARPAASVALVDGELLDDETPVDSSALSIRAVYRRLLALGEHAGAHRSAATTPLEHLPALAATLAPAADLVLLTARYSEVRYGEREASAAELDSARAELERVATRAPDT